MPVQRAIRMHEIWFEFNAESVCNVLNDCHGNVPGASESADRLKTPQLYE